MTLFSTLQSARLSLWHPQGSHHSHPSALARMVASIVRIHLIWQQRQQLATMDASLLDDIGLNRDEALAEAARPIWDVPRAWRN